MAPKRRSQTAQRAAAGQQSKLSFQSKVTKPGSAEQTKKVKKDPSLVEDVVQVESPPIKTELKQEQEEDKTLTVEEDAAPDPLAKSEAEVKTEEVLGGRAKKSDAGAVGGKVSGWVGDEEERAKKITDSRIKEYWRAKERERIAPRVHQEDLTVYEKVLREWDMSGQYGPCIGIARLKRWKRANLLGLQPPIEVLAVILKQLDAGDAKVQRAYVDELMTSRFTHD